MKRRKLQPPTGALRPCNHCVAPEARLLAFPWAGAGVAGWRRIFRGFTPRVDVQAVQLPGREDLYRYPFLSNMKAVVDYVIDDLTKSFDLPLFLMGHSFGGLIAVEVAKRLESEYHFSPAGVIVSAASAPGLHSTGSYQRCPASASRDDLIYGISLVGGTAAEILNDSDLLDTLLPIIRADYRILDDYRRLPSADPIQGALIVIGARDDVSTCERTIQGWSNLTTGPFTESWVDGGHFYLLEEPIALTNLLTELIDDHFHFQRTVCDSY